MKLSIKRSEFLKLLSYASQVIPSKSAEIQFMNFLINVQSDAISIIASNGDISVKSTQTLKDSKGNEVILSAEEGSFQIQAKLLLECVSKMSGDIVSLIMVDSNLLNLSDGISEFNLVTAASEEYPNVDVYIDESLTSFKTNISNLKKLFDTTNFAAALKNSDPKYTGISVIAKDGKLSFSATDSFRLARMTCDIEDKDVDCNFIVTVKALDLVIKSVENSDVTIYANKSKVIFVSDNCLVSSSLLPGEFPTFDKLIFCTYSIFAEVDTAKFIAAAERVKIIANLDNDKPNVRLTLDKEKDSVLLSARYENYGNSNEKISNCILTFNNNLNFFEININIDNVINSVKALNSEKFNFCFNSDVSPFMVSNDDSNNIQILTPIRRVS